MTDDQIKEIVNSRQFFQTELIEDRDNDHEVDDNDDIRLWLFQNILTSI